MLVGGRAKHAVCLTGLERSFEEIGANVREGVFSMLGGSAARLGGQAKIDPKRQPPTQARERRSWRAGLREGKRVWAPAAYLTRV